MYVRAYILYASCVIRFLSNLEFFFKHGGTKFAGSVSITVATLLNKVLRRVRLFFCSRSKLKTIAQTLMRFLPM